MEKEQQQDVDSTANFSVFVSRQKIQIHQVLQVKSTKD